MNDVNTEGTPVQPEIEPDGNAVEVLTAEIILNAAVAFAGHVVTLAQQAAEQGPHRGNAVLRDAMARQYLLETATLSLRKLGESYAASAEEPALAGHLELLQDGAARAATASNAVEALGDLGLDLLDRLLE